MAFFGGATNIRFDNCSIVHHATQDMNVNRFEDDDYADHPGSGPGSANGTYVTTFSGFLPSIPHWRGAGNPQTPPPYNTKNGDEGWDFLGGFGGERGNRPPHWQAHDNNGGQKPAQAGVRALPMPTRRFTFGRPHPGQVPHAHITEERDVGREVGAGGVFKGDEKGLREWKSGEEKEAKFSGAGTEETGVLDEEGDSASAPGYESESPRSATATTPTESETHDADHASVTSASSTAANDEPIQRR